MHRDFFVTNLKEISEIVSTWTKQAGSMLPKSAGEVEDLIQQSRAVVLENDGQVVAFAAITFEWPDGWKELGSVVVEPSHRERGLGHQAVQALIGLANEKHPGAKLFALCNDKSLKLFLDAGAEVISDMGVLPVEVWGECINCPKRSEAKQKGNLCCDTPVRIK